MKYVPEVSSISIIHCNAIGSILHSHSEALHIQILALEVDVLSLLKGFLNYPCKYTDATLKQEVTSYFASFKCIIHNHLALSYLPYTINKALLRNLYIISPNTC